MAANDSFTASKARMDRNTVCVGDYMEFEYHGKKRFGQVDGIKKADENSGTVCVQLSDDSFKSFYFNSDYAGHNLVRITKFFPRY